MDSLREPDELYALRAGGRVTPNYVTTDRGSSFLKVLSGPLRVCPTLGRPHMNCHRSEASDGAESAGLCRSRSASFTRGHGAERNAAGGQRHRGIATSWAVGW